jgi:isopentenyldiphosphate isomerase
MSAEEIFDIVDQNDAVVGQRARGEVHRLGLRHRAVHVLVFNEKAQLFLQKRSLAKDCSPGAWDSSASGHLTPGEEYDACALRETQEELGLVLPRVPTRLFKIDASPATGQEFVWVYRCQADGPFQLDPVEIEWGDWFSPEQISRWIADRPGDFAASFVLIWQTITAKGFPSS